MKQACVTFGLSIWHSTTDTVLSISAPISLLLTSSIFPSNSSANLNTAKRVRVTTPLRHKAVYPARCFGFVFGGILDLLSCSLSKNFFEEVSLSLFCFELC